MPHPMTQDEKYKMMTEAPIPPLIGKLAVPTIVSMLITSIYNMADTFFVGRIGTSATAAVGVVFPVMAVIQALGFFCGHGSGNSISRHLGSKDTKSAEQLAATGFFSALLLGLAVMILGLLFLNPLAVLLGSTETILPYTRDYLRIILIGAPYMTAQLVLNNQLRFQGNAFYAMIGITTGGILNMALDPLFIFGLQMGISGAALATVISQFVSFLLLLYGIKASKCIPIRLRSVSLSSERLGEIAGGGLPSLFRQGLASVATMVLNIAANPYGDAAIAAMSVVGRITMFANSALIGFGQGFQPVCGYNYGARKYGRVKKAFYFCVKLSFLVLAVLSVVLGVFAREAVALFRDNDPLALDIGARTLLYQCFTLPLMSWVVMSNMMLQTIGRTAPATFLAMARQGVFFIPLVWILSAAFGMLGIQMTQTVSDCLTLICAIPIQLKVLRELSASPDRV